MVLMVIEELDRSEFVTSEFESRPFESVCSTPVPVEARFVI